MPAAARLLICSDIHYAGPAERQRIDYEIRAIDRPWQRLLIRLYLRYFWLRDPFAHNHLLDRVLDDPAEPDCVVANGDFSCDSAFVGVADPAARESAALCLGKLRSRYGGRFAPVFGDHELGKTSLGSGQGGLRLLSLEVAREQLSLETVWTRRFEHWVLIGVASTLAALPVYERETLPEEWAAWQAQAEEHRAALARAFDSLRPDDRVLLFCHDPTALPFLGELPFVRRRMGQIERTIIGHLHSPIMLAHSRRLAGLPTIGFCGQSIRRMSQALSRAKAWREFNLLLCPSLAGLEWNRTGGYYRAELGSGPTGQARFDLQEIRR